MIDLKPLLLYLDAQRVYRVVDILALNEHFDVLVGPEHAQVVAALLALTQSFPGNGDQGTGYWHGKRWKAAGKMPDTLNLDALISQLQDDRIYEIGLMPGSPLTQERVAFQQALTVMETQVSLRLEAWPGIMFKQALQKIRFAEMDRVIFALNPKQAYCREDIALEGWYHLDRSDDHRQDQQRLTKMLTQLQEELEHHQQKTFWGWEWRKALYAFQEPFYPKYTPMFGVFCHPEGRPKPKRTAELRRWRQSHCISEQGIPFWAFACASPAWRAAQGLCDQEDWNGSDF